MIPLSLILNKTTCSEPRVVIIRSAHIGDFIVCIPFLERLLCLESIKAENVYFVILNNSSSNPVSMLFGEGYFPSQNVMVVSNKASDMFSEAIRLRQQLNKIADYVLYLPFHDEPSLSMIKKMIFLKAVFGPSQKIHGICLNYKVTSNSQYYSLLEKYGYPYGETFDYMKFLRIGEKDFPEKVANLLPAGPNMRIAIYPHSKLQMKIWPKNNYVKLITHLVVQYSPHIYLLGSVEDRDYNTSILQEFSDIKIYNVAGEMTVRETISFLSNVDLIIGNDGAPLHMAALANTPIVGIYTYKAPVGVWEPILSHKLTTIRNNVECKECNKESCARPVCITKISVNAVLNEVRAMLTTTKQKMIVL